MGLQLGGSLGAGNGVVLFNKKKNARPKKFSLIHHHHHAAPIFSFPHFSF